MRVQKETKAKKYPRVNMGGHETEVNKDRETRGKQVVRQKLGKECHLKIYRGFREGIGIKTHLRMVPGTTRKN